MHVRFLNLKVSATVLRFFKLQLAFFLLLPLFPSPSSFIPTSACQAFFSHRSSFPFPSTVSICTSVENFAILLAIQNAIPSTSSLIRDLIPSASYSACITTFLSSGPTSVVSSFLRPHLDFLRDFAANPKQFSVSIAAQ